MGTYHYKLDLNVYMSDYFKHKCPNCGKETINYDPNKVAYCSKECQANSRFGRKFIDERQWKTTPLKGKK